MVIREIQPWVKDYVTKNKLRVLRRKKDGVALNVSYTDFGLSWTANKSGRLLMYKRAFVVKGKFIGLRDKEGNLIKDDSVYCEDFIPTDKKTEYAQVAECTWVAKAMKLLYESYAYSGRHSSTESNT